MYLNPLTDKIEIVLGSHINANQLNWNVSYQDITYLNVLLPRMGGAGNTNGTTPVTIVPSSPISVTRQVVHINVFNADNGTKKVIIRKDVSGTKYVLLKYDLTPGDTLMWSLEDGWRLMSEGAGTGGIISLNSLAATIQVFATGTSGNDFNIDSFSSTHTFNIPVASAANTGKLSSSDWSTFNSKQAALSGTGLVKSTGGTITYLTDNTANWDTAYTNRITALTTTGTGGAATLSSNTLNIPQYQEVLTLTTTGTSGAATLVGGTLNIPQYSGGGGGVTSVTGTTPIASSGGTTPNITIADAVADGSTKGAATFNASDFNSSSGVISIDYANGQAASSVNKGFLSSTDWTTFNNKLSSNQTITLSGDVTGSGTTSIATTIANAAVTLSKMANLAANSIIGNNTGSSSAPVALTQADVTAMLNLFNSTLKGLVPASGGGTANFLRADGTWAVPTGGGGGGGITAGESIAYAIALG